MDWWTWFITVPLALVGLYALGKWLFDQVADSFACWVDERVALKVYVKTRDMQQDIKDLQVEQERIHGRWFDMAVKNARQDRTIDELQTQIQKLIETSAKAAEASRAVPKKAKKGGE